MTKDDYVIICGDFGGASSHDIDGGILELDDPDFKKKKKELDKGWKPYRINHLSWWKEELPSAEEMEDGRINLQKHSNKVDFIVTHCASSSTVELLSHGMYKPDMLTNYLEEIRQTVRFKKWFFGHYHDNVTISPYGTVRYEVECPKCNGDLKSCVERIDFQKSFHSLRKHHLLSKI